MGTSKILIEVREARKDDLSGVVDLWEKLATYHSELSDEFALAWDGKRRWSKYLHKKFSEISTKLIVAEEGDRIVGFLLAMLSPNYPIFKERKIGLISDVYVLEARRGKGITKKMLDVAIKWFKKNKVRSVHLTAAVANKEGQEVWRLLGFEPYMISERLDLDQLGGKSYSTAKTKIVRKKKQRRKGLASRIRLPRGLS